MPPPITFLTPIILGSNKSWSSERTARTHMSAKNSFSPPTSLELRVVIAHFFKSSSFSSALLPSIDVDNSLTRLVAKSHASLKLLMIFIGCTPSSTYPLASLSNSPAMITTVVVPSPTSLSCALAMSTSVLAAGCTISNSFIIVAPSFEIVVTPLSSRTNLSNPRGPSVVRTASATAQHALMFDTHCPRPCDVSVPSRSNTICGCYVFGEKASASSSMDD